MNHPLQQDERLDTVNEDLCLIQKKNGLTFGTDAFLLAAYVRPSAKAFCIDLGSGTGILPLLLCAKDKVAHVTAVELQPAFCDLIARNAALNGMDARITHLCSDVRALSSATFGREADLVVSNPPYMKCTSGKRNEAEEKYIARHEVHGDIVDFCAAAGRLLKHGGKFYVVWRPDRLSDLMRALYDARLEPKRMTFVHSDAHHEPSSVLIEAMKGGAPSVRITPPLLLQDPVTGALTKEAQDIYDTCRFPTLQA